MSEAARTFLAPADAMLPFDDGNLGAQIRVGAAEMLEAAANGVLFRQVLDALPAAVYTTDRNGRITYYNRAAVDLAGREPVIGSDEWCVTWRLYTPDGDFLPHDQCPMAVALKENRAVRGVEALAERPDGSRRPFLPFPTPLCDDEGRLVGAVNMLVDISERKDSESRQKLLLAELNHRVKNNMQMLYSLLKGAEREAGSADARAILSDASGRVGAMALAQQTLYQTSDPSNFSATEFIEAVCGGLRRTFETQAALEATADHGVLSNDVAMPLALMLNELVTNAVKHGRKGEDRVCIRVALTNHDAEWMLSVRDNGPGFELAAPKRGASGLGLVDGLASQLSGSLCVTNENGAACVVTFPAKPQT